MKKSNLIIASVFALIAMPAIASASMLGPPKPPAPPCDQTPTCNPGQKVINDQLQFGDTFANLVVVSPAAGGGAFSGLAAGNTLSVRAVEENLSISSNQKLDANVISMNNIAIDKVSGALVSTAVAQGNAGQYEACCANTNAGAQQIAVAGNEVTAVSMVKVKGSDSIVSNAQAVANNWGSAIKNAHTNQWVGQYNAANVKAGAYVDACCNNKDLVAASVAAANSNSMAGLNATIYSTVDQKNYANVSAETIIKNNSATNNTGSSSAVANNTTITNEWGYVNLNGYQENLGGVNANTIVLNGDWGGMATAGASAMGNSALVSNIGSDVDINLVQGNWGGAPISANATFVGSSSQGGVGMASSYAAGNSITGYSCAGCNPNSSVHVNANSAQYNYSNVSANTYISGATSGMLVGSATAIGNSATYIAQKGN